MTSLLASGRGPASAIQHAAVSLLLAERRIQARLNEVQAWILLHDETAAGEAARHLWHDAQELILAKERFGVEVH